MTEKQLRLQIKWYWHNFAQTGNIEYWKKGYAAFNQLAKLLGL
nr:MAG TPA: YqzL-like protein [Caudoviricetes sp.]